MASEGVSAKKGAISLDSLVSRKANAGPPMLWRIDKAGPGLAIDAERTEACRMGERTGPQWGVQLVDLWLGQKTYDVCIACCSDTHASMLSDCTRCRKLTAFSRAWLRVCVHPCARISRCSWPRSSSSSARLCPARSTWASSAATSMPVIGMWTPASPSMQSSSAQGTNSRPHRRPLCRPHRRPHRRPLRRTLYVRSAVNLTLTPRSRYYSSALPTLRVRLRAAPLCVRSQLGQTIPQGSRGGEWQLGQVRMQAH